MIRYINNLIIKYGENKINNQTIITISEYYNKNKL